MRRHPVVVLTPITLISTIWPWLVVWATHPAGSCSTAICPWYFPGPSTPSPGPILTNANTSTCGCRWEMRLLVTKLFPIKLMTVFEGWQITGLRWKGIGGKVLVFECIHGVDSSLGIELQKLRQQRYTRATHPAKQLASDTNNAGSGTLTSYIALLTFAGTDQTTLPHHNQATYRSRAYSSG